MRFLWPIALLAAISCSRNAAYRERALAAPVLTTHNLFADASANPAGAEQRYKGQLVRFQGQLVTTGADDRTVIEDRSGACAMAAGLGAMGSSMNGQRNQGANCQTTRQRNVRVVWAGLGADTQGGLICEFGSSFEDTIAPLRIGDNVVIAGKITKISPNPQMGFLVWAKDCVAPSAAIVP